MSTGAAAIAHADYKERCIRVSFGDSIVVIRLPDEAATRVDSMDTEELNSLLKMLGTFGIAVSRIVTGAALSPRLAARPVQETSAALDAVGRSLIDVADDSHRLFIATGNGMVANISRIPRVDQTATQAA